MILGAVDWFSRDEYWIIESERKMNTNIGKSGLTKVDQNGSIGATGYYHVLAIPHQPMNEVVTPEYFALWFT
jgi:hypothetical protein